MPMNWKLYPRDWKTVSAKLKAEVGNKCEGCGVPNGVYILRNIQNPERYFVIDENWQWAGLDLEEWREEPVRVVLTTAHLDQNPGNNDRSNLRVLCQRCHLVYDAPFNQVKKRRTRLKKNRQAKLDAGQLEIFEEISA